MEKGIYLPGPTRETISWSGYRQSAGDLRRTVLPERAQKALPFFVIALVANAATRFAGIFVSLM
jgi:hypothetical protein